jgi:hypothetical protein
MGDSEKRLLRLSRTPITLHELLARSGLLEFEALKALHRLATAGLMAAQKTSATPSDDQAPGPSESKTGRPNARRSGITESEPSQAGMRPSSTRPTEGCDPSWRRRSDLTGLGPDAIPRMIMRYDAPELMHSEALAGRGIPPLSHRRSDTVAPACVAQRLVS